VRESRFAEHSCAGDPVATAEANARGKAIEVLGRTTLACGEIVVGVDTVVTLDGGVYGKATGEDEARRFLTALGGRTHVVLSGLCLAAADGVWSGVEDTAVTFAPLDDAAISRYLSCGEWRERAGAYAIQGVGAALVTAVEGDYWNVVGLPVALLVDTLRRLGVEPFGWLGAARGVSPRPS